MAKNLRAKIAPSDVLLIHDRNTEATTKFRQEVGVASSSVDAGEKGMNIELASSAREVAERSVRPSQLLCPYLLEEPFRDEPDLYPLMI